MSTSLISSKTFDSRTVVVPVDSVDTRSTTIARLAFRKHEIPGDVVRQLVAPSTTRVTIETSDPLVDLMAELLRSSQSQEPSASTITKERRLGISLGLANALRWLYKTEPNLGEPLTLRMMLRSLMPLYLAAGQGRAGTGMQDTVSLLRTTCMIVELDRLTSENELAEWLRQPCRSAIDPLDSLSKAFRIGLPTMANVFWREIAAASDEKGFNLSEPMDSTGSSLDKYQGWWSLACQLCSRRPQITVPVGIVSGVVAWDKLLDHWQRVRECLSTSEVSNTLRNSTSDSSPVSISEINLVGSEMLDPLNAGKISAGKESSKTRLATDHRFVEIRSARDPQLSSNLDQLLRQCRNDQGTLSLIVVKKLGAVDHIGSGVSLALQNWQSKFIEYMDAQGESANVRGFISNEGELTLVFQDVERTELTQWIRDSFAKFGNADEDSSLATPAAQQLVAGVALVNSPSKSFKIDQLIQAAWRCLDGASHQGAGAVKTIEVY